MEVPGSNSHSGGEKEGEGQDALSEEEAALGEDGLQPGVRVLLGEEQAFTITCLYPTEATETGRKERGEENLQVHRGPQEQRTPCVSPIKTLCASCLPGLLFLHRRLGKWGQRCFRHCSCGKEGVIKALSWNYLVGL